MSDSDHFAVRLEEAHLAAVLKRTEADAIRLPQYWVPDRDVRDMNRHFLGDDASRLILQRIRAGVLLDLVDACHQHVVSTHSLRHIPALALVAPGDNDNVVALLDLAHVRAPPARATRSS